MGFFRRSKDTVQAGPPPAEMRGRAAEIDDAGSLGWEVVWEALKTEPPADDASSATLTQELGLDDENEVTQPYGDIPATAFSGTRHGRRVALRIGVVSGGLRSKGYTEVQLDTSVAPFRVREEDGRPVADPEAMPEVTETLAGLTPSKAWRDVDLEGGPDGILARRPVTAHPQGYVYDMWLAERLADRLGA